MRLEDRSGSRSRRSARSTSPRRPAVSRQREPVDFLHRDRAGRVSVAGSKSYRFDAQVSAACSGSCDRPRRRAAGSACRRATSSRKSHHRHPQADDLGAAVLDDVLRLDGVAERLGHLAAVLVDDEAVRHDLAERRPVRACPGRRATSSETSRGADRCLRGRCPRATSARRETAAPLRDSSRNRTRRRGCRARARTRCRRTSGT